MKFLLLAILIPLIPSTTVYITPEPQTIQMLTTAYSEIDSCHYPAEGGCLVASGKLADKGMVACPRSMELGTMFEIAGRVYTCEDRYNADLSDRLDLWHGYGEEAHEKALNYGERVRHIKVLTR